MAEEEKKAEGQEPEKAPDEAEAMAAAAEERKQREEEVAAAEKRRYNLLEEYSSASSMVKSLQAKLEELRKSIYVEMDTVGKDYIAAGEFAAMRTQKSRTGFDRELLELKVAKEVLAGCMKTSTYWELKVSGSK